jgi:hypothetical protein
MQPLSLTHGCGRSVNLAYAIAIGYIGADVAYHGYREQEKGGDVKRAVAQATTFQVCMCVCERERERAREPAPSAAAPWPTCFIRLRFFTSFACPFTHLALRAVCGSYTTVILHRQRRVMRLVSVAIQLARQSCHVP